MTQVKKYGRGYSFSDFLNAVTENSTNENAITLNGFEDTDGSKSYTLNDLVEGDSPYDVKVSTGEYMVATIHNHPNGTPPSGSDVINTAKWVGDYPSNACRQNYVYTTDNIYCLYIEDVAKAKTFYSNYSSCMRDSVSTGMFKSGSDLDKAWNKICKELSDYEKDSQNLHTLALGALLRQTDSGIILLKKVGTSSNNPFGIYSAKIQDNKIIPFKCE